MPEPLKDSGTLTGMKHNWIFEGTEDGIKRYWCEKCEWERERYMGQVGYRRDTDEYEKQKWLARCLFGPTAIEEWSPEEPECDSEE